MNRDHIIKILEELANSQNGQLNIASRATRELIADRICGNQGQEYKYMYRLLRKIARRYDVNTSDVWKRKGKSGVMKVKTLFIKTAKKQFTNDQIADFLGIHRTTIYSHLQKQWL